ncbi:MAG: response regulator [Leptospirales bacterium]|nr:response regulator [Leptospirales bacterium]
MTEAKILIVEDESIVALNLQNRLKSLGYGVAGVAASGEDAVKRCGEVNPDLVLMDIMLQGEMDGIGAAERIRKNYDVPVVYLTAYADDVTLDRAKMTEPFGYILKPFEVKEIRTTVEIALYKHKMERLLRESEERYMRTVSGANDGIWDWDLVTNTVYYSPRWKAIFGFDDAEIGNSPDEWLNRVHADDRPGLEMAITRHIEGITAHLDCEFRILTRDKTERWAFVRAITVKSPGGKAVRLAGSLTDITRRHQAEEQLLSMAGLDTVTELANEALFLERLWETAHSSQRYAVIRISVNVFQDVYRKQGPTKANTLLSPVGKILRTLFSNATPARLYGGEFAILIPDPASAEQVQALSKEAQARIESELGLKVQVGHANAPAGTDCNEVFIQAGQI